MDDVHLTTENSAPTSTWARVWLLLRTPRRGRGFWYGLAIDLLWPWIMVFSRPVWRGQEHIPAAGPVVLAANHLSFVGVLPRLLPRTVVHTVAGPPVDLGDLRGLEITERVLATATERVMTAITAHPAMIRDELPPG